MVGHVRPFVKFIDQKSLFVKFIDQKSLFVKFIDQKTTTLTMDMITDLNVKLSRKREEKSRGEGGYK